MASTLLLSIVCLFSNFLSAAQAQALEAAVWNPVITPAAFMPMKPRQAECDPGLYLCADGESCCDIGDICGMNSAGIPICTVPSCDPGIVACTDGPISGVCCRASSTCAFSTCQLDTAGVLPSVSSSSLGIRPPGIGLTSGISIDTEIPDTPTPTPTPTPAPSSSPESSPSSTTEITSAMDTGSPTPVSTRMPAPSSSQGGTTGIPPASSTGATGGSHRSYASSEGIVGGIVALIACLL